MILAAGLGTRLKPLTDTTPKALIKINGRTLLELQIKKLKAEGFDEIIINVHHFAEQIIEFLKVNNKFGCKIDISDETNLLLETGGGLKKASHFFNDGKPFLIYNVDIISNINLKKLFEAHLQNNSIATVAVQDRDSSRKFLFDNEMVLCGWTNQKTGEQIISRKSESNFKQFAFSGIQIIDPKIFNYFPDKNIFSLVELYLEAAKQEKIKGFIHNQDELLDLGKIENIKKAEELLPKIRNTYPA